MTRSAAQAFTLTLAATTVSEGGGVEATMATVSRGTASPRSLAVEMESSNPNAGRVPELVTIARQGGLPEQPDQ